MMGKAKKKQSLILDLVSKRDPILTRAARILGIKIEPEKAASMFPVEWRK